MEDRSAAQIGEQAGPLLLVVDDERSIVDFIRLGMRYEGFRVADAGDGQTGLDLAQRLRPDLIVLDVMLPDLDGLQVCQRLRANPLTANLPILMLTAKDEVSDRVAGLEHRSGRLPHQALQLRGAAGAGAGAAAPATAADRARSPDPDACCAWPI